jgi:hypothetical protein
MITAIVQYKLPPHIDLAACAAHFRTIAPDFRAVPGLIRKQFIYAEDGWAGGVYLWQTREAAEAFYTGAVAGRHPSALRHGPADQVLRDGLHHRQCVRGGSAARGSGLARGTRRRSGECHGHVAWPSSWC